MFSYSVMHEIFALELICKTYLFFLKGNKKYFPLLILLILAQFTFVSAMKSLKKSKKSIQYFIH